MRVTALIIVILILLTISYIKMRPVVIKYALSTAETVFLNSANEAVIDVLNEEKINYDDIITLSKDSNGYVTSLETNVYKINYFKSKISNKISKLVSENENYDLKIPIGSFFSSTYFQGFGPKFHFKMQLTSTAVVDFEHEFKSAGINQVLHMVVIKITVRGSLVMIGATESTTVSTTAIAAQTVIVGTTPDAFTNVYETGGNNSSGLINDYAAKNNIKRNGD